MRPLTPILTALCLLVPLPTTAQTKPAPAPPPAAAASATLPTPGPPDSNYAYQAEGRRDPFLNLLNTGSEPRLNLSRGNGMAGLQVGDVSVRGIVQNGPTLIALVQGPDKKTYMVRAGDKFMDGSVKSVTPDGLVVVQDVNDPLSLVKTREVRKLLRSREDAKQ